MSAFTADEKRQAIDRELKYRMRVYARLVQEKKMTQALADREIAIFRSILADYEELAKRERLL